MISDITAFYGDNGAPCVADSYQSLLRIQCEEIQEFGSDIPEPGCLGLLGEDSGASETQRAILADYLAQTAASLSPEEFRDPALKCQNGTTMKSLFLTFMVAPPPLLFPVGSSVCFNIVLNLPPRLLLLPSPFRLQLYPLLVYSRPSSSASSSSASCFVFFFPLLLRPNNISCARGPLRRSGNVIPLSLTSFP